MYYIKCEVCGEIMSQYDEHYESEEFEFYCPDCYKTYFKEQVKEIKSKRVKDFFSMFGILSGTITGMTIFLLVIPVIGYNLGVPDWGGLLYIMLLLITVVSVAYALRRE